MPSCSFECTVNCPLGSCLQISELSSTYYFHTMATRAFILLLVSLAISSVFAKEDPCVYTIYVRTGKVIKGGTDSKISAGFYDVNGYYLFLEDLEKWGGLMSPGHNYYERGNLDIFSGLAGCLTGPICQMNLTSDGSGDHAGWYCNYVEVTMTGPHISCNQRNFEVEQWLALDAAPYELSAVRGDCSAYISSYSPLSSGSKATMQEMGLPSKL